MQSLEPIYHRSGSLLYREFYQKLINTFIAVATMSSKNGALIEQEPLKVDIQKASNFKVESTKPKRRDKSDLGENFIPPDGGWGWAVAVGSGLGTVSNQIHKQNITC